MSKEYRVTIDPDGKMHLIDENGEWLSPTESRRIGQGIYDTASNYIYVYLVGRQSNKGEYVEYKIGMTNNPERRGKELFKGYQNPAINYYFPCDEWGTYSARNIEKALHTIFKFAGVHITGEWFKLEARDVALFKKWFGSKKGVAPKKEMMDVLLNTADICRSYQKKSDYWWRQGTMIKLFNEMPQYDNYSYEQMLASFLGYRRTVEVYPRHFDTETLESWRGVWQSAFDKIVEFKHDEWMQSPVDKFFASFFTAFAPRD